VKWPGGAIETKDCGFVTAITDLDGRKLKVAPPPTYKKPAPVEHKGSRPATPPSVHALEWLEYWAGPAARKMARRLAYRKLAGLRTRPEGRALVEAHQRFYREALSAMVFKNR